MIIAPMQNRTLKPCCPDGALLYHMGNAGDLLKHGVLAEFVRWRCESPDAEKPFRFLDPFGGLPFCGNGGAWCGGKNPAIERFCLLKEYAPDCALVQAQSCVPDRYYGSGHVVRLAAGGNAKVLFSDQCPNKREILSRQGKFGFTELKARGFDPRDGYSALNVVNQGGIQADLILIDPCGDFLPRHGALLPHIAEASKRVAVVLFVLNKIPTNNIGKDWAKNKKKFLPNAWTLSCPRLAYSEVKGESTYDVEVILAAPCLQNSGKETLREFNGRLSDFADAVCRVVSPVRLSA